MTPILLLVIALLSLAILNMVIKNPGIVELFTSTVSDRKLIIATAKWCPHCVSAMPEFSKVASASPVKIADGSSVVVKLLDEKENKDEISALNIQGFPSVIFIDQDGKRMEYGGPRTFNGIMEFMNELTAPTATTR